MDKETLDKLKEHVGLTEPWEDVPERVKFRMENWLKNKGKHRKKVARQFLHLWRMYKANDCKCYICDEVKDFDEAEMSHDHVFPASLGYTRVRNVMPSCKSCNNHKSHDIPTPDEIERAMILYEKMGDTFDPYFEGDCTFHSWKTVFAKIGVKHFEGS